MYIDITVILGKKKTCLLMTHQILGLIGYLLFIEMLGSRGLHMLLCQSLWISTCTIENVN